MYRRDPKDIALADGREEWRQQVRQQLYDAMEQRKQGVPPNMPELDCTMDHVPWETETTGPPIYTCGYCGAQMTESLVSHRCPGMEKPGHADEITVYDSAQCIPVLGVNLGEKITDERFWNTVNKELKATLWRMRAFPINNAEQRSG